MSNRGLTIEDADAIIEKSVEFPDIDAVFERVRPITDFRRDGAEARILYICQRKRKECSGVEDGDQEQFFVLKCKIQTPLVSAGGQIEAAEPLPGPSEYTAAELKVLQTYADVDAPSLPHLVAWKKTPQGSKGPVPGGYIVYTVMTLMPGRDLLDLKFWSMNESEREEIREKFLIAIKSVWRMGFEPYDCALRNILWEAETKTLSLVDFEHWHPTTMDPINMNEQEEMQRWGIVQRPPAAYHWMEWRIADKLMEKRERDFPSLV